MGKYLILKRRRGFKPRRRYLLVIYCIICIIFVSVKNKCIVSKHRVSSRHPVFNQQQNYQLMHFYFTTTNFLRQKTIKTKQAFSES